jgi:hypothetical protein
MQRRSPVTSQADIRLERESPLGVGCVTLPSPARCHITSGHCWRKHPNRNRYRTNHRYVKGPLLTANDVLPNSLTTMSALTNRVRHRDLFRFRVELCFLCPQVFNHRLEPLDGELIRDSGCQPACSVDCLSNVVAFLAHGTPLGIGRERN